MPSPLPDDDRRRGRLFFRVPSLAVARTISASRVFPAAFVKGLAQTDGAGRSASAASMGRRNLMRAGISDGLFGPSTKFWERI